MIVNDNLLLLTYYINQSHQETSASLKELKLFHAFEKQVLIDEGVRPIRTEWKLAAEKEKIGGTVDFVGLKKDGTYLIADWKTTKDLRNKLKNNFNQKAKYVLIFYYGFDNKIC